MKIIVDDKIPYIGEALDKLDCEVVFLPGSQFTPEVVRDANALIIRTRTRCNQALLEGSRVTFIATATIGYDHIDTEYCRKAGITWTNAPGCNSGSVAQYIQSVLILLQLTKGRILKELCLGVVGVGNVGSKVVNVAQQLGMRVLQNDLPRAEKEGPSQFVSLEQIGRECDIISLHVPLYRSGSFRTFHLADNSFFDSLIKKPVLINTSRGEVVETQALLEALQNGTISEAVIDVWENEPDIDRTLLEKVWIGTPHIAGYSADGKANATRMSLEALCKHFNLKEAFEITPPQPEQPILQVSNREEAILKIYDPRRDSEALKSRPEQFEQLRGNYPLRREEAAYTMHII